MLIQLPSPTPTWLNRISENVSDPSWWFTAFLVAIVASIFAAYLKELLGRVVSLLSSRFRYWWLRRRFRLMRDAHEASHDTHIILFLIFQSIFYFLAVNGAMVVVFFVMTMATLTHDQSTFPIIFIPAISLFLLWSGYMLGKRTSYILLVWRVHMILKQHKRGMVGSKQK